MDLVLFKVQVSVVVLGRTLDKLTWPNGEGAARNKTKQNKTGSSGTA